MNPTARHERRWLIRGLAVLPVLFGLWSISLVIAVSRLQLQVSSNVTVVSRFHVLNATLADLSTDLIASPAAIDPATDGDWEERIARYRKAMAALASPQTLGAVPPEAQAITALVARLEAIQRAMRFQPVAGRANSEAEFLATQRQALREVENAVRSRRENLSALSHSLAAKWRWLNVVVGLSCLQSLVLGVFLAKHQALVRKLQDALGSIKVLTGLLPICSSCKKIRDNEGYWSEVEKYISGHSDATFSHGVCEECSRSLYPDFHGIDRPNGK